MTKNKSTFWKTVSIWGVIGGVVLSGLLFIPGILSGLLFYIVLPIILFLGITQFRDASTSFSLNDGFKTGICITLLAGLIFACFQTFYQFVLNPDSISSLIDTIGDEYRKEGIEEGVIQINKIKQQKILGNPIIPFAIALARTLLFGSIYSLIIAIIIKKRPIA